MEVYVISTTFSVIFAFFVHRERITTINHSSNYKSGFNFFAFLSFMPMFLVSGLRYNVGMDYAGTYMQEFRLVAVGSSNPNIEIGYYLLNKLVLLFTQDYFGIFLVTSFAFCFIIYLAIYQQSPNPPLSIFILVASTFYFYSLNGVRQCLAMAIFAYSIKYIKTKQFKKYLILTLIATSIHMIAIIGIPIYLFCKIKMPIKRTLIVLVATMVLLPFSKIPIYYIILHTKYDIYIGSIYDVSTHGYITVFINLIILALIYFYYYHRKDADRLDSEYDVYLNIQIISTIFSLCLGFFPLASRLFYYYFYIQFLTIPFVLSYEKNKKLKLILIFIIVALYSIYFIYSCLVNNSNSVLPYQTIFSR